MNLILNEKPHSDAEPRPAMQTGATVQRTSSEERAAAGLGSLEPRSGRTSMSAIRSNRVAPSSSNEVMPTAGITRSGVQWNDKSRSEVEATSVQQREKFRIITIGISREEVSVCLSVYESNQVPQDTFLRSNPAWFTKYRCFSRFKESTNPVVSVRERTIPTERPPLVGKVSANFCG
jgi:hypothetical protein